MLTDLKAWLWLSLQLDCGPAWQVLRHFGAPEPAYFADPAEYELVPGLSAAQRTKLEDKSLEEADRVLADCDGRGIGVMTWQDSDYPERLRNIDLPPLVLYHRGTLPRFDEEIAIAMAGSRRASPYGRKVAGEMAFQIARLGGLVLTGIVEGCDLCAADGALKAGGPLVCVLAGGVDVPYYANDRGRRILEDVAACGALLSEQPPGAPHLAERFARRNQILTGLALGTVCVEAPVRSGTLQVAALALEAGRDVYAVPANIDAPAGAGTNGLLTRGEAICVCSGADVLEHYWALYPQRRRQAPQLTREERDQRLSAVREETQAPSAGAEPKGGPAPMSESEAVSAPEPASEPKPRLREISLHQHKNEYTDDEREILHVLEDAPLVTDAIVVLTDIPARRVSSALTVLTIRGLVAQLPGGRFEALVRLI